VTTIEDQDAASRRFGAAYFTALSVEGVRCFGPRQRLVLSDREVPAKTPSATIGCYASVT
jgi:hypothetical protein